MTNNRQNLFNQLYHSKACFPDENRNKNCLDFKISDQYMCPNVSPGETFIEATNCHEPRRPLGQHPNNAILQKVDNIKKDPDFQHATNLVMSGGKVLAEYFINNLPQIIEQRQQHGGGGGDDLVGRLQNTALTIGGIVNDLMNKLTVGDAVETFIEYYQNGEWNSNQMGGKSKTTRSQKGGNTSLMYSSLPKPLKTKIDSLKNDAVIYGYLLNGMLSTVTVGDVVNSCLRFYNSMPSNMQMHAYKQTGGSGQVEWVRPGSNVPLYTNEQQYTNEMVKLFDNVTSTVDALINNFKEQMVQAPNSVHTNINQIQQGLALAIQIIRNQITSPPTSASMQPKMLQPKISQPTESKPLQQDGGRRHSSIPSMCQGSCSVHPLNYLLPSDGNITPSVYLNPCEGVIAKHPVRSRRIFEYDQPELCHRHNITKCLNPHWNANCV